MKSKLRRYLPGLIPAAMLIALSVTFLVAVYSRESTFTGSNTGVGVVEHEFAMPTSVIDGFNVGGAGSRGDFQVIPPLDPGAFSGRVWALHIWASWCEACRTEGAALEKLSELLPIAGLAYRDAPVNAAEFLLEYGNHYDALGIDEIGLSAVDWGMVAVPETILIDGGGTVRWRYRGAISVDLVENKMHAVIARLMSTHASVQ